MPRYREREDYPDMPPREVPTDSARVREQQVRTKLEEQKWREPRTEAQLAARQSESFYTRIGYPQYAGRYAPFKIPEGHEVAEIREADGLEVSFKPIYKAPYGTPVAGTYTEMRRTEYKMYHHIAPTLISARAAGLPRLSDVLFGEARKAREFEQRYPHLPQTRGRGFEYLGGIVETGETYAEIIAPYPVPIPERPLTPARVTGLVTGAVAAGAVVSWVAEPGITPAARHYLTKKYLEKGPLAWKGWKEKAVMRLTGVRPHVAPGVVSIPTSEAVGMKELAAQQLAWELTQAPKTTGLMITKVGPKKTVFTFTRGVGYTPMSVTLARAMGVEEMGGRQALLQLEKPALKTTPFIPTIEPIKETVVRLPQMILALTTLSAFISVGRPQAIERLTIPLISPIVGVAPMQRITQRQRLEAVIMPVTIQQPITTQALKQESLQIQRQLQRQISVPSLPTPTRGIFKPPTWPFEDPFKRKRHKRKIEDPLGLFGRYPRVYPLATPKQVLEMIIGKRRGKKK